MASANPFQAFPAASNRAVFFHCLKRIIAATGVKPADRAKDGAQCSLVDANESRNELRDATTQETHVFLISQLFFVVNHRLSWEILPFGFWYEPAER